MQSLHRARHSSRCVLATAILAAALLVQSVDVPAAYAQDAPCEITSGFAHLRWLMGTQDTGFCVEHPWQNEVGHTLQRTNVGVFVWRPGDNWTGFTDGFRTWLNGPHGLAIRPNSERFPWEADAGGPGAAAVAGAAAAPVPTPSPRPAVDVLFDWYSASVNGASPHGNHAAYVKPGDEVTIRLNTVTSHDAVFVVDVEVFDQRYDALGREAERRRVLQLADQHHFIGKQPITLEKKLVVPSLPKGRYRIHLGVFTPDWQHLMAWNDYVGFIDVG